MQASDTESSARTSQHNAVLGVVAALQQTNTNRTLDALVALAGSLREPFVQDESIPPAESASSASDAAATEQQNYQRAWSTLYQTDRAAQQLNELIATSPLQSLTANLQHLATELADADDPRRVIVEGVCYCLQALLGDTEDVSETDNVSAPVRQWFNASFPVYEMPVTAELSKKYRLPHMHSSMPRPAEIVRLTQLGREWVMPMDLTIAGVSQEDLVELRKIYTVDGHIPNEAFMEELAGKMPRLGTGLENTEQYSDAVINSLKLWSGATGLGKLGSHPLQVFFLKVMIVVLQTGRFDDLVASEGQSFDGDIQLRNLEMLFCQNTDFKIDIKGDGEGGAVFRQFSEANKMVATVPVQLPDGDTATEQLTLSSNGGWPMLVVEHQVKIPHSDDVKAVRPQFSSIKIYALHPLGKSLLQSLVRVDERLQDKPRLTQLIKYFLALPETINHEYEIPAIAYALLAQDDVTQSEDVLIRQVLTRYFIGQYEKAFVVLAKHPRKKSLFDALLTDFIKHVDDAHFAALEHFFVYGVDELDALNFTRQRQGVERAIAALTLALDQIDTPIPDELSEFSNEFSSISDFLTFEVEYAETNISGRIDDWLRSNASKDCPAANLAILWRHIYRFKVDLEEKNRLPSVIESEQRKIDAALNAYANVSDKDSPIVAELKEIFYGPKGLQRYQTKPPTLMTANQVLQLNLQLAHKQGVASLWGKNSALRRILSDSHQLAEYCRRLSPRDDTDITARCENEIRAQVTSGALNDADILQRAFTVIVSDFDEQAIANHDVCFPLLKAYYDGHGDDLSKVIKIVQHYTTLLGELADANRVTDTDLDGMVARLDHLFGLFKQLSTSNQALSDGMANDLQPALQQLRGLLNRRLYFTTQQRKTLISYLNVKNSDNMWFDEVLVNAQNMGGHRAAIAAMVRDCLAGKITIKQFEQQFDAQMAWSSVLTWNLWTLFTNIIILIRYASVLTRFKQGINATHSDLTRGETYTQVMRELDEGKGTGYSKGTTAAGPVTYPSPIAGSGCGAEVNADENLTTTPQVEIST